MIPESSRSRDQLSYIPFPIRPPSRRLQLDPLVIRRQKLVILGDEVGALLDRDERFEAFPLFGPNDYSLRSVQRQHNTGHPNTGQGLSGLGPM